MADPLPEPNQLTRYVDREGRLTPEGWRLLAAIVELLRAHETRIAALEP